MLVAIIGFGTMFSVMQRGDEWNELEQAFAQSNAEDQHAEDQVADFVNRWLRVSRRPAGHYGSHARWKTESKRPR